MCLRDFNRGRPEGGELFATTPSLMSVRMLLTIASWTSLKVPNFVALVGDVTQAFVHAPIDEWIQTRVPDSLDGLEVRSDDSPVVLRAGMFLDVLKALYGYRKSPRLWQDWITDKLMQIPLRRSKVEPSIFYNDEKTIFVAMHVDDLIFSGPLPKVEMIFKTLQQEVLIHEVGRLVQPGDELTYLGKIITRTTHGFELRSNDKLVESYIRVCGVEASKGVDTAVVR